MRVLRKSNPNLQLNRHEADHLDGGVNEALAILSREQRWLNMARGGKAEFNALCEGWMTAPAQVLAGGAA